jgi:hypothetical protein
MAVYSHEFITWAPDGSGQLRAPAALLQGERALPALTGYDEGLAPPTD